MTDGGGRVEVVVVVVMGSVERYSVSQPDRLQDDVPLHRSRQIDLEQALLTS